jgi:hypothetical protein
MWLRYWHRAERLVTGCSGCGVHGACRPRIRRDGELLPTFGVGMLIRVCWPRRPAERGGRPGRAPRSGPLAGAVLPQPAHGFLFVSPPIPVEFEEPPKAPERALWGQTLWGAVEQRGGGLAIYVILMAYGRIRPPPRLTSAATPGIPVAAAATKGKPARRTQTDPRPQPFEPVPLSLPREKCSGWGFRAVHGEQSASNRELSWPPGFIPPPARLAHLILKLRRGRQSGQGQDI